MLRLNLGITLVILSIATAFSQDKYLFSNKLVDLQFEYNHYFPSGDFSKRYGNFNSVGFGGMLKTQKNWILSADVNYLFGKEIKETSILDNLVTSGGYIGSIGGSPGNYSVNMRGWTAFVDGGRVFGFNKYNMNSGILVRGGAGLLIHRINFQNQDNAIPQLDNNYKKGYDRYSSGLAFHEFIGYVYHSQSRHINFFAGVDFMQAFTHNRRKFNYDTRTYDTGLHHDFTTAIRIGWLIPIYLTASENDEYMFR